MKRISAILVLITAASIMLAACALPDGGVPGDRPSDDLPDLTVADNVTDEITTVERPAVTEPVLPSDPVDIGDGEIVLASKEHTITALSGEEGGKQRIRIRVSVIDSQYVIMGKAISIDLLDDSGKILDQSRIAGIGFISLTEDDGASVLILHEVVAISDKSVNINTRIITVDDRAEMPLTDHGTAGKLHFSVKDSYSAQLGNTKSQQGRSQNNLDVYVKKCVPVLRGYVGAPVIAYTGIDIYEYGTPDKGELLLTNGVFDAIAGSQLNDYYALLPE